MVDPSEFELPDPSKLGPGPGSVGAASSQEGSAAHNDLMAIPGVVMVGEGLDESGRPALIVGVRAADDLAAVPASFAGLPVLKQVIGEVVAQPLGKARP